MENDFELFPGKKLSHLFKDIYDNQSIKKRRISELINDIKTNVKVAGDWAVLGPIIKDLVETSVKNDDSLVKLAVIVQRIMATAKQDISNNGILSEEEKQQLLKELDEVKHEVMIESDVKIDKIDKELKSVREKLNNHEQ
jgi:argininosuccinate lyase